MRTVGVVMAGGRGKRMRASGVLVPKPLVRVGGVPLLVRAVCSLLRHDVTDIVVIVPATDAEIGRVASTQAGPLVSAAGGRLEVVVEDRPLGNMGGVRARRGRADATLVLFADNVTTLDLGALLQHHVETAATMTLATHEELFHLPYGRLALAGGDVVGYDEKPTIRVPVASAVTALAPEGLELLSGDQPTGMVDLCRMLLERAARVSAYRHDAPWVDVNDAASLVRAEVLLASHTAEMELWWHDPEVRKRNVVVDGGGVLVPDRADAPWVHRDSAGSIDAAAPIQLDTLEKGRPVRYQVHPLPAGPEAPPGWRRLRTDQVAGQSLVLRLLAALGH